MKMWRKSFVALGAITALTLTGCSGSVEPVATEDGPVDGTGKTIDAYVLANALFPEEQREWLDVISEQFTEQTGAEVRWEMYSSGSEQLQKIQTSVVSGQGPDIYGLSTSFTPTAYATGGFMTLDEAAWDRVGGRDKFIPATLGISGPSEDEQIAVPLANQPFVLAYNTELFAAAGLDEPSDSWDGIADQAEALTKDGVYGLSVAYADQFSPWKFIWGMNAQAGNPTVDDGEALLDDEVTKTSYETYFGWLEDGLVDPQSVGWNFSQAITAFADGKAAILPMTVAATTQTLDASAVAGKYKFVVMPTIPPGYDERPTGGVEAASMLGGANLVVADYSKEKDLSLELIRVMTDPEGQLAYFELLGDLPANAEVANNLPEDGPDMSAVLAAADLSVATPFTGAWADVQLALQNVVVQSVPELSAGGVSSSSLDAMLVEAQASAQAALDRVR